MLSPEERMQIGQKVLARLKPKMRERTQREQNPLAHPRKSNQPSPDQQEADSIQPGEFPDYALPSLQALIEGAGPLSPCSVILGACDDGLPFLLDLNNPAPGSILIAGDSGSGKTALLYATLVSALLINAPSQVMFTVVAVHPEEFSDLAEYAHCHGLLTPEEFSQAGLLENLVSLVEGRQAGNRRGPAVILAFDDLLGSLQYADDSLLSGLHWLIENGPTERVWVVASLTSEHLSMVDATLLEAFGTRLVGSTADSEAAVFLTSGDESLLEELAAGYQFTVAFGEEWMRFWICPPV